MLEVGGYTDAKIVFNATRPSMIPVRLIDTKKAETLPGFKVTTGLREGITRTIDWYHNNCGREVS